jgi:catechol 2,3-dioxygenase-like lactoylglutathione lyase family enzyme
MTAFVEVRDLRHTNRYEPKDNVHRLTGIDHVGLACRDPDVSGEFVRQVLGGVELFRAGYDEEDRRLGRLRHIFYHVGQTLVEVVEQEDGQGYPDKHSANTNPHWSFGATPDGLAQFIEHLRAEGIPFDGPRSHRGVTAVSVYFVDPDGNHLEVTTWSPIPVGLMDLKPMGGPYGFIPWEKLAHDWRPTAAQSA